MFSKHKQKWRMTKIDFFVEFQIIRRLTVCFFVQPGESIHQMAAWWDHHVDEMAFEMQSTHVKETFSFFCFKFCSIKAYRAVPLNPLLSALRFSIQMLMKAGRVFNMPNTPMTHRMKVVQKISREKSSSKLNENWRSKANSLLIALKCASVPIERQARPHCP